MADLNVFQAGYIMTNSTKKIIFFVDPLFRAMSSPVLQSQVFMHMKMLSELGCECHFFGADRPGSINKVQIQEICCRFGIASFNVVPVRNLGLSYRQFRLAIKKTIFELNKRFKISCPDFTFAWNIPVWNVLNKIPLHLRGVLVFQCQGALSCEIQDRGGWINKFKSIYWRYQEKNCFENSDILLAVAHKMRDWISEFYQRKADFILPCCYDDVHFCSKPEKKHFLRKTLGWAYDVPVVVYAGGASHWQRIPDMMYLLSKIQKALPQLHVLFLSSEVEYFNDMIKKYGLIPSKCATRKLAHDVVSDWLNIADVGLVLRYDTTLNNVASPIKLAEYLACGLAVIATHGIGDYSALIEENNAGVIIEQQISERTIEQLVSFLSDGTRIITYRKNAYSLAREFAWSSKKEVLCKMYGL